jgi:hypothetical protein
MLAKLIRFIIRMREEGISRKAQDILLDIYISNHNQKTQW